MLGRKTPYRTIVVWKTDRLQPWMSGRREGGDLRPASSDKSERLLRFNGALRYLSFEFALKVFSCRNPSKLNEGSILFTCSKHIIRLESGDFVFWRVRW